MDSNGSQEREKVTDKEHVRQVSKSSRSHGTDRRDMWLRWEAAWHEKSKSQVGWQQTGNKDQKYLEIQPRSWLLPQG